LNHQTTPPQGEVYLVFSHPGNFDQFNNREKFVDNNLSYCGDIANFFKGIPTNPTDSDGVTWFNGFDQRS
jgi:hypothetical protein